MKLGSKIENLKIMKSNGIPVPDFAVLPFSKIITNAEPLHDKIDSVASLDINEQSRILKETVRLLAIKNIFTDESDTLYSVRSSCGIEDSKEHSFAGQFDTYLNVPAYEISERITDCVCSLFNVNVIDYMHRANLSLHELEMNVIVQKMVNSDVSGVIFTANPQGILNESVIIAGKGLGENVVSDRIDTTAYYYNTTDNVYYYDGKEELLDREKVEELISLSKKICSLFTPYTDIEFAMENGKIYILQARPITTISDQSPLIFDNSNIVESYPGLSLPLTESFVFSCYEGVFRSAGQRILKNNRELERLQPVFGNTVGCVNGRMYYKISNWYEIINCLPFHKKFMPIWQELVGVKYKEAFKPAEKISPAVRVGIYYNTIRELLFIPKSMEKLHDKFKSINRYVTEKLRENMSAKQIFELYDMIEKEILSDWGLTLLNDTYAFLFTGILKKRLSKKHDDYEAIANQYISGIANIESLKPIKGMIDLALDKSKLSDDEYEKRKSEYIKLFGDRSLEELKLESETFRTNPELLDAKINEYTSDPKKLQNMSDSLNKPPMELHEDPITSFLCRRAVTGIMHREKSRLNRSRIFGLVREVMLKIGKLYCDDGLIDDVRDIFYLTLQEVRELANSPKIMQSIVEKRKNQYKMYSLLPAYSRIVFSGKEFNKNHRSINTSAKFENKDEMNGIPCSGGIVEGEALVVEDVTKVKNVKDKILITKMTDPGWVFLLAAAKAVVSEKGSLLSHTAIISRELGIPAVVGIDKLMNSIHTGDIIRVDGTNGTVKIVKSI